MTTDSEVYHKINSVFDMKAENLLESKHFLSDELKMDFNTVWKLEVKVTPVLWLSKEFFEFKLELIESDISQFKTKCKLNLNGKVLGPKECEQTDKGNKISLFESVSNTYIDIWPDSDCRITCEIELSLKEKIYYDLIVFNGFKRDFSLTFNQKSQTDFTIIINEREYEVHSQILSSRSSFFAALLRNDMKEKRERKAYLSGIDANVFEIVLKFIYYGDISQIDSMAQQLFIISDMYDIIDLKLLCSTKLFQNLTLDNVLEAFRFSDMYHLNDLKQRSMEFVIEYYKELKLSQDLGFDKFLTENIDLTLELLDKCINTSKK